MLCCWRAGAADQQQEIVEQPDVLQGGAVSQPSSRVQGIGRVDSGGTGENTLQASSTRPTASQTIGKVADERQLHDYSSSGLGSSVNLIRKQSASTQCDGNNEEGIAQTAALTATAAQAAVQEALSKASKLLQMFGEAQRDRATPVHVLRRVLKLVVADCKAAYASVHVTTDSHKYTLLLATTHLAASFQELSRLSPITSSSSVELLLKGGREHYSWSSAEGGVLPPDWANLQAAVADLGCITSVPIKSSGQTVAILTVAFLAKEAKHDVSTVTYLQLVAAGMSAMVHGNTIPRYMDLLLELHASLTLDAVIHTISDKLRIILEHQTNQQVWYRIALLLPSPQHAMVFDDLSTVPSRLLHRQIWRTNSQVVGGPNNCVHHSAPSRQGVPAGKIVRSTVLLCNTVLKIAVSGKRQVAIPDVQKLIIQSGVVCSDIFTTRVIKPPTSVLLVPLRANGDIFGVIFCMSTVMSDFTLEAPRLREAADVLGPHIQHLLSSKLASEFRALSSLAISPRHSTSGNSDSSHGMAAGVSQPLREPSTRRTAGDSVPRPLSCGHFDLDMLQLDRENRAAGGTNATPLLQATTDTPAGLGGALPAGPDAAGDMSQYSFVHGRSATGVLVTAITEKLNQKRIWSSMELQRTNSLTALQITHLLGEGGFGKVFRGIWRGLTVGVKVVCDEGQGSRVMLKNAHEIAVLSAIRSLKRHCLTHSPLWLMLHRSHPNIMQAYLCLTDVSVRELLQRCSMTARIELTASPAYRYLVDLADCLCHVEIVECCDYGTLTGAIRAGIFRRAPVGGLAIALGAAAAAGAALPYVPRLEPTPARLPGGAPPVPPVPPLSPALRQSPAPSPRQGVLRQLSHPASPSLRGTATFTQEPAECSVPGPPLQCEAALAAADDDDDARLAYGAVSGTSVGGAIVRLRVLIITLIEIASAMAHLHQMGVVHCDLKPQNILLKSSNIDPRGFNAKVADFGLSRLQDDDSWYSFTFNSCGTAAYVAPEAFAPHANVDRSVDVYSFGILMWEIMMMQQPYGNLAVEQLADQVVHHNLRPQFSPDVPADYVTLAAACWQAQNNKRPTFDEVVIYLNNMLVGR